MKLGIDSYSTRNSGLDAVGVVELAEELGLEGVLFEVSPWESFQEDYLACVRRTALERGLYLEFGMGSIFPWHPMAEKGRRLLQEAGYATDSAAGIMIGHLEVAQKLGSPVLRCVCGNLFTRDEGHDMDALADQAVQTLRDACHAAEDLGMKIAVENHADFTARELASIHARVDSPALGFTVDLANLAFDLDEPSRSASILATHALTTHLKDYWILRTPRGLALGNCALGDGDLDVAALARLLAKHDDSIRLNIEIHSQFAPFRLDILDRAFWNRRRAPPGDGLAWFLEKAWSQERWLAQQPKDLPDGAESWRLEQEHLRRSIAWARHALAPLLGRSGAIPRTVS